MRTKGKLTSWNYGKGFGFIQPTVGGKQVFIHIKAFKNRNRRPEIGQFVTYSLSSDRQGRPCAENATLAGDRLPTKAKKESGIFSVSVSVVFIMSVSIAVLAAKIPAWFFYFYIIASLLTFIMYAVDKSAAQKGTWRTPESTLHFLSLIGGWPGALVAQQKLRHKSKKQPFRLGFMKALEKTRTLQKCRLMLFLH